MFVIQVGKINSLKVLKHSAQGIYLDGQEDGEILLPVREVTPEMKVDEVLKVFIYFDSEDRLIATQEMPFAMVGDFAHLKVKAIERVGTFLDWGLAKDLFVPYAEQTRELKVGQYVVVYLYEDKSDRISASMRIDRYFSRKASPYNGGEAVNLFIVGKTDLGFKAVINNTHVGILYFNEVFTDLDIGTRILGYIKTIRPDGKIDLILHKTGHLGAEDVAEKILDQLTIKSGFLPLTDKSSPQTIYQMFGVSKKKYKIALGRLYKKRLISIENDGIRLLNKPPK